jgi:hypothetical protein
VSSPRSRVAMCTSSGSAAKCTRRVLEAEQAARADRGPSGTGARVAPVLAGAGVLQLAGRHRQAIHREQQVHRVVLARVAEHLARDRELVLAVKASTSSLSPVRRLEVGERKVLP